MGLILERKVGEIIYMSLRKRPIGQIELMQLDMEGPTIKFYYNFDLRKIFLRYGMPYVIPINDLPVQIRSFQASSRNGCKIDLRAPIEYNFVRDDAVKLI
jgi:hypothetical protein